MSKVHWNQVLVVNAITVLYWRTILLEYLRVIVLTIINSQVIKYTVTRRGFFIGNVLEAVANPVFPVGGTPSHSGGADLRRRCFLVKT